MSGFGVEGPGGETPPQETFRCPKCGHSVPVGTPICGNCGTILQGGSYVPEPLAASGIKPGAVIVFAFVLALGVGGFLARDQIADLFESAGDAIGEGTDSAGPTSIGGGGGVPGGGGGGGGNGGGGGGSRPAGARNVGEIVREIRAAGIPCTSQKVDSSDDYVATGSCQSEGQHVQINLYFRPESMAFAEEFYADWAFATVHRDNWWISGNEAVMRRIHKALGGKFTPPS